MLADSCKFFDVRSQIWTKVKFEAKYSMSYRVGLTYFFGWVLTVSVISIHMLQMLDDLCSGHDPSPVCNIQSVEGHTGYTSRAVHCTDHRTLRHQRLVQFAKICYRYGLNEATDPRRLL